MCDPYSFRYNGELVKTWRGEAVPAMVTDVRLGSTNSFKGVIRDFFIENYR